MLVIFFLPNNLVFRRLDRIIVAATRIVGGDYRTPLQVTSEDEVLKFEELFEQFLRVFVDVLGSGPEPRQSDKLPTRAGNYLIVQAIKSFVLVE